MKKMFTLMLAAAAVLGFSACSNDDEATTVYGEGTIRLNFSADDAIGTRAVVDVADPSDWYAKVTNTEGTVVYNDQIGSEFEATKFAATGNPYTVYVSNYANADAALAANGGFGAAFYEGSDDDVNVVAGSSVTAIIACGKAKNAAFKLNVAGFGGTINEVAVSAPRAVSFTSAANTLTTTAFFAPAAELTYTIDYTINGNTRTTAAKTLTLGAAATQTTLTIATNSNGTITVNISYDDEFTDVDGGTITFDAVTGDEV